MGENWTMSIFYPILSGKKWTSFFCIFTKQLSNRVFFLYWKTWEILEFSQKVKFCSNSQSGIENFKVCINCWLFTPLDYKLLIVVSRKISLWYIPLIFNGPVVLFSGADKARLYSEVFSKPTNKTSIFGFLCLHVKYT